MVAVACFLSGRAKDLLAPPRIYGVALRFCSEMSDQSKLVRRSQTFRFERSRREAISTAVVDKKGVVLKRFASEAETVDIDVGMALEKCCARETAVRWYSA